MRLAFVGAASVLVLALVACTGNGSSQSESPAQSPDESLNSPSVPAATTSGEGPTIAPTPAGSDDTGDDGDAADPTVASGSSDSDSIPTEAAQPVPTATPPPPQPAATPTALAVAREKTKVYYIHTDW